MEYSQSERIKKAGQCLRNIVNCVIAVFIISCICVVFALYRRGHYSGDSSSLSLEEEKSFLIMISYVKIFINLIYLISSIYIVSKIGAAANHLINCNIPIRNRPAAKRSNNGEKESVWTLKFIGFIIVIIIFLLVKANIYRI